MVKQKPTRMKGSSYAGAWENVNRRRYDCYPKNVATYEVWVEGLPIVEKPVKIR